LRISEKASLRSITTFCPKYSTSPISSLNLIEFNELISRRRLLVEKRSVDPDKAALPS